MNKSANHVSPTLDGSVVRNTVGRGSKQMVDGLPGSMPDEVIHELYDKHYNQQRRDSEPSYYENLVGTNVFARLGEKERNLFTRLGGMELDVFSRLSERQREIEKEWNASDRANCRNPILSKEASPSESENSEGGQRKSRSKRSGRPSEELPTTAKHKQFCGAAEGILIVFLIIEEVHKRSHRDPSHQAKRRRINKGVHGSP
ncbi:hypothetical protein Tco_0422765 [Tanacetum coccineum]